MGGPTFGELADTMVKRASGPNDDSGVGGLVWAVSVGGEVAKGSAGWLDYAQHTAIPTDAIFRIASISKPIVTVAALQLVDAGALGLDDPIDPWLPELADRQVLIDPAGPIGGATVPAERALTLRDLLTFRCGLGMDFDFDAAQPMLEQMWEWEIGPGPTPPKASPDEFMALLGQLPLADQPGARWRYHTGSDVVGVLIERVLGQSLEVVLARDVLHPLAMADTGFWVPPEKLSRLGVTRAVADDGSVMVWDHPDGRWSQPPAFRSGAAGVVSTADDLVAFGQMLLRGGTAEPGPFNDGPILAPGLVAEMTTDQLTAEQARVARIGSKGSYLGWGLGISVQREPGPGGWPPVGSFGWDGGLGSRLLVVPELDLCAVLLLTDDFSSPAVPQLLDEFVALVGQAATRH